MKMAVVLSLTVFIFANASYAAVGEVSGPVTIVRSHDISIGSNWFQIDSPAAGSCANYNGKPIFILKDNENGKRQFAMVVAAKMAGKNVTVSFDDTALLAGPYCYVRFLDI